jgi:opacity protein-like surface antigen
MMQVARGRVFGCARTILGIVLCAGTLGLAQIASTRPAAAQTAATDAMAPPSADAPKPGGWQFEIAPYLWGAGLSGDVKVGRLPQQGVEASFSDLVKVLDIAGMAVFEGRKGRWGFLLDTIYINLSETEPTPDSLFGDAKVDLTQQLYTLYGTWRVVDGKTTLDLMGGARYVDMRNNLELTSGVAAGREATADVTWWDGLVGARVRWGFAKKWGLVGYGEIGGGGTKLTWQALAGVDWRFSKHMAAKFGYRYLSQDYDHTDLLYDMAMAGGYAGLGFRF